MNGDLDRRDVIEELNVIGHRAPDQMRDQKKDHALLGLGQLGC